MTYRTIKEYDVKNVIKKTKLILNENSRNEAKKYLYSLKISENIKDKIWETVVGFSLREKRKRLIEIYRDYEF